MANKSTYITEIRNLTTKKFIEFLQKKEALELIDEDFNVISRERINGLDFFKLTEEKLRSYGMKGGPATRIAEFANEFKEKKSRVLHELMISEPITFSSQDNTDSDNGSKEKKLRAFHECISEPITFSIQDRRLIHHAELPKVTNELSVTLRLNILCHSPNYVSVFHKGEVNEDRTPVLQLQPNDSAPHARFSVTGNWNAGNNAVANGLTLNRWYHLVYTLSEPKKKLNFYIDGKWVEFHSFQQDIKFNNGPLWIGNYRSRNGFTGLISNFRYYNWSLSAEEVKEEYLVGNFK
ncbi:8313_t:CDS:2 [Ambispora leptoticha]|uniref:8313_t:CDS:1 n=1 Tax=Ambispora leptoticha TaxID=144679 RepID=A0A9N8V841_9GLOM|nr:8313_t:CDS:2 [Ambispora leptoticha]